MKRNESNLDRTIRAVLAVVFGVLYFTGTVTGPIGIVLLVIGAVFLLTAIIGFCPLYAAFKLNTNKA
jgi:hypothetical protein